MPKRGRSDSLTGGTGDVNPQILNLGSMNPTTGYTEAQVSIPVQRLRSGNKSQVMEVLWAEIVAGSGVTLTPSVAAATTLGIYVTTKSFGTTEPTAAQQDGNVIISYKVAIAAAATAANLFGPLLELPKRIDCTDGNGHGILVATDYLYTGVTQTGADSPITGNMSVRLGFRWKNVSLQEYVGIVQSQQ